MSEYKVPLRDIQFATDEVLDFPAHYASLPGFEDATPDMVEAILEEAAKFVEHEIAPLRRSGDLAGCAFSDGDVAMPDGFCESYTTFVESGWPGLSHPEEYGGQGLPPSMNVAFLEMVSSANHAWTLLHSLTSGAITTLLAHGNDKLQSGYLAELVSGRWSGTMCLTEAHAGSDLGLLRTRAEPAEDGTYRISGGKIFITFGEHDMTENIVHIVLARLPDAPKGTKGISLFLVPKFLVNEDGTPGERNAVTCGSIEHKMGIHASPTCVLNFDGAVGYLVGEPNRGLNHMFTFINESRLGVAQQGHGAIELAYQGALAYARERLQMRAPVRRLPEKPADPIIAHPDVRRMLLTQKALSEGGRLLVYYIAKHVDTHHSGESAEQRQHSADMLALLTPIAKGFLSEAGIEAANLGIQVFGGHGYIGESGMEQIARDVRITALYEGTTGIQALDLLGRKILASGGELLAGFVDEINEFVQHHQENSELSPMLEKLAECVAEWRLLTEEIGASAGQDADEVNAAAVDYLMYSGYACLAYFWARAAQVSIEAADTDFYRAKLQTARFYYDRILPRTLSLAASMRSGAGNLTDMPEEAFSLTWS